MKVRHTHLLRATKRVFKQSRFCDVVGMVCSCACAVHCAAMPFVIAWLPSLGLSWLADEGFHQWMAGICFLLAIVAVLPGYRRHRRRAVPVLAIAGVSVLATGAFAIPDECCQQCVSEVTETSTSSAVQVTPPQQDSGKCPGGELEPCCENPMHDAEGNPSVARKNSSPSTGHRPGAFVAAADGAPRACCEHETAKGEKQNGVAANAHSKDLLEIERERKVVRASLAGVSGGTLPDTDGWLSWLSSLLTPLGGCLLVVAHLMNRRFCHCCAKRA